VTDFEIARAIRQASLALPTNHPVQAQLDAAHEVLLSTTAAAHEMGVVNSHGLLAASGPGREPC
jgi:hypothetical protein